MTTVFWRLRDFIQFSSFLMHSVLTISISARRFFRHWTKTSPDFAPTAKSCHGWSRRTLQALSSDRSGCCTESGKLWSWSIAMPSRFFQLVLLWFCFLGESKTWLIHQQYEIEDGLLASVKDGTTSISRDVRSKFGK
jgi:hypothetical protein